MLEINKKFLDLVRDCLLKVDRSDLESFSSFEIAMYIDESYVYLINPFISFRYLHNQEMPKKAYQLEIPKEFFKMKIHSLHVDLDKIELDHSRLFSEQFKNEVLFYNNKVNKKHTVKINQFKITTSQIEMLRSKIFERKSEVPFYEKGDIQIVCSTNADKILHGIL